MPNDCIELKLKIICKLWGVRKFTHIWLCILSYQVAAHHAHSVFSFGMQHIHARGLTITLWFSSLSLPSSHFFLHAILFSAIDFQWHYLAKHCQPVSEHALSWLLGLILKIALWDAYSFWYASFDWDTQVEFLAHSQCFQGESGSAVFCHGIVKLHWCAPKVPSEW